MPLKNGRPPIEIVGSSMLIDLYGYWPSFHDAVLERIAIDRIGSTVMIEFTTCDMVFDGDEMKAPDQQARVILRWYEVSELSLGGIDSSQLNRIGGLGFSPDGKTIRCVIELMDAMHGVIVAGRVEVLEVEPL
jgi:hypothetical protein